MPSESELRFYYGAMGSGKSTLALQIAHNLKQRSKVVMLTKYGREDGMVSSRLGVSARAARTKPDSNYFKLAEWLVDANEIEYFICDESQFFTVEQVEHLAQIVDLLGVSVYAFGLMTTFQGKLFEGSKRLVELSDRLIAIDTELRCLCGRVATMNARFENGVMVDEGVVNVIGDITPGEVSYQTMCRRCWTGY